MAGFTKGEERHYTRDVLNRRKAIVGYLTYRFLRLVLRREALRRVEALRQNGSNGQQDRQGGLMIKDRTRSAGAAAAGSATALVEAVRPIVQKAMNDPELHDAIRQAFATGREVTGEIQKNKPSKAARNLAENRKLHRRVESSVQDLQKAVTQPARGVEGQKEEGQEARPRHDRRARGDRRRRVRGAAQAAGRPAGRRRRLRRRRRGVLPGLPRDGARGGSRGRTPRRPRGAPCERPSGGRPCRGFAG